ncbi:MAG TPA: hypothetical protein VGL78_04300 [Solirubrobacteraceae bacterium]|jgi:hypothetical protein
MSSTDAQAGPRPDSIALSRVRNSATALADVLRRPNRQSDPDAALKAFAAFERACDAARPEPGVPSHDIRAAISQVVSRPDRLTPLLALTDGLDPYRASNTVYDLVMALRSAVGDDVH